MTMLKRYLIILLYISIFLCLYSNILPLSVHWPANGDKVTKTHYEFVDMPTDTTVWDFSHAIETGESHDMRWLNLGDSLLVRIEQGSQSTYGYRNDTIIMNSYENALFGMYGDIAPIVLSGGFPCTGDSIISHFDFSGKYCGNNAVRFSGVHIVKSLDSGTLILPNDTLANVIRIRQTVNGVLNVSPHAYLMDDEDSHSNQLQHSIIFDRWYSQDFKYELAENILNSYICTGQVLQQSSATYLCSPDEQELSLGIQYQDPPRNNSPINGNSHTQGCSIHPDENFFVLIDDSNITVTFNSSGAWNSNGQFSLILSDSLGRIWSSQTLNNSSQYQVSIPTSGLPTGNYVLYVSAGEETDTYKLQIK